MRILIAICITAILGAAIAASRLNHTAYGADTGQAPESLKLPAPELISSKWINADNGLTLAGRKGKVTIVEFWTFACSNCQANLPAYANWLKRFADKGVVVIGIHTPETESEKLPANVAKQVARLGITYPVLIDSDHKNWDRWGVEAWPTVFVIDKKGQIRYRWVGELNYRNAGGEVKIGRLIDQLISE